MRIAFRHPRRAADAPISRHRKHAERKTVISFCQTHPVDHYILKWQPPFVFARGQSISILAKPVGRLEHWIIAHDPAGSQCQILRNNRSAPPEPPAIGMSSLPLGVEARVPRADLPSFFAASASTMETRHGQGFRVIDTSDGYGAIEARARRTRKSGGLSRVPRIITLTGLQSLRDGASSC